MRERDRLILYPAIDIRGGRAVRLVQGRFEDETVYRDDPLEAARDWVAAGARALHVVDLDGARDGRAALARPPRADRRATSGVPVQYGGGLRSIDGGREPRCDAGAERVILGTAAFRDMDLLDEARAALRRRA